MVFDLQLVAPRFVEVPQSVTNFVGGSAVFDCRASGLLPLTVQWFYLNNTSLVLMDSDKYSLEVSTQENQVSNQLTVVNITLSDSGVYQCRAGNEVDEIAWNVTLEVLVQGTNCTCFCA